MSGSRRPAQAEPNAQRSDARQPERRPYQQDRARGAQGQPRQQAGGFAQKQTPGAPARQGAPSGRNAQGRGSASRSRFDSNRENTQSRGKNAGGRRDGKDRNEKYNRFDANDRVQTGRRRKDQNKTQARPEAPKVEEKIKTIILPDHITLKELADKMKIPASAIIKKLFMSGKMVTMNSDLTYEEAEEIAVEYEILCEHEEKKDLIADLLKEEDESEENMVSRPPVVCVMGHVDHGKTSLLDAIRDTHVTDRESGGITKHIGASVIHYNDRTITFLDTPGHEAFTAMRMRGANSTDIAVLVVAADDGVMPQTEEAISHAKAAGVPIVVALNKMDLPGVSRDRVVQELAANDLMPSEWGGDVEIVETSAVTGQGIDTLMETLLMVAELHELKARPDRSATGVAIESSLEPGQGVLCTLLVQNGTLHNGDIVLCGNAYGKVRAMFDTLDPTKELAEAPPSTPVSVLGLDVAPGAGSSFVVLDDISVARQIAEERTEIIHQRELNGGEEHVTLESLKARLDSKSQQTLNIIIRTDVRGSIEAIRKELSKLEHPEVKIKILQASVGGITEADVLLADASDAIIVGFNVVPDELARITAEKKKVQIRRYDIIYKLSEDIRAALEGMLKPAEQVKELGRAFVQQIFVISRIGTIAGCRVLSGTIERDCRVRLIRDSRIIGEYVLETLRREKDDAREVREGYECGIKLKGFNDIKEGDYFEAYKIEEVARTL